MEAEYFHNFFMPLTSKTILFCYLMPNYVLKRGEINFHSRGFFYDPFVRLENVLPTTTN